MDNYKEKLTEEQYQVTRCGGTERAFSGQYDKHYEKGIYTCVCCDAPLFTSDTKFNSGTGWPSYFQPASPAALHEIEDKSHGMRRTEVMAPNQLD
jgi:peptide-methionine (R)-S-oxide reductase